MYQFLWKSEDMVIFLRLIWYGITLIPDSASYVFGEKINAATDITRAAMKKKYGKFNPISLT